MKNENEDEISEANEEELEELLKIKKKIEGQIKSIKRSQSRHKVDFDDNINDRDSDFNANESPIKSQISNKFDNKPVQVAKPRTQAAPPSSSQTINPILGFSESDPKRKKFKDEYSEYVKNGLKEDKEKIRSKSRRNNSGGYIRDDVSQSNYHNEYAQKQRYQHSYFKYGSSNPILQNNPTPSPYSDKLYMKENSVNNQYDDRFSKIGGQRYNGSVDDRAMQGGSLRRDYSPTKSIVSIIPDNRDAQIDKEQKQKALAEELKSQMLLKEQQKQKEKEAIKNQEYKNMQEFLYNNPFGRMGAGAPIRDSQGHIVANRMKLFDPEATSFQQSFYNNRQDINPSHFDMTDHKKKSIQNLNDSDIGLQFLEWSNQERRRKDMKMDEWKRALDEQSNLTKKKKQDEKRKILEEDLYLEQKIKKDLQEMNEDYEKETGRRSNKYAGHSVGKESSVNYVVPKSKSRKGSEYKRSEIHTPSQGRSGSNDRMRDFKGLNEAEDDIRSFKNYDYTNEINIRNLREDLKNREGTIKNQLNSMKEFKTLQQEEIKHTYDSLLQLQIELDQKNKNRKIQNNDFYNTLAAENKTLLSNLRNNKRNTINYDNGYNKSFGYNGNRARITPYEQQYGFSNSNNYYPTMHHESVFINAEVPQFNPRQSTNEALDDLLQAYNGTGQTNNFNNAGKFELPMPKTSLNNIQNNINGQQYNDDIIKVDDGYGNDNIGNEDTLDKFVDDANSEQRSPQDVS